MNLQDVKIGLVVVLNSGSPSMTVKKIKTDSGTDPLVYCEWFNSQTGDISGYDFLPETLKLQNVHH